MTEKITSFFKNISKNPLSDSSMHHDIKTKPESNRVLRKHLHLWQDSSKGAAPCIPGQPGIPEVQMLLENARGQNPSLASLETVKPDSSCLQPLPDLSPKSLCTPRRSPARIQGQVSESASPASRYESEHLGTAPSNWKKTTPKLAGVAPKRIHLHREGGDLMKACGQKSKEPGKHSKLHNKISHFISSKH